MKTENSGKFSIVALRDVLALGFVSFFTDISSEMYKLLKQFSRFYLAWKNRKGEGIECPLLLILSE